MTRQIIIYSGQDKEEAYTQKNPLVVDFSCDKCIRKPKCEVRYNCKFGNHIFHNTKATVMNMHSKVVSLFIPLNSGETMDNINNVIAQAKEQFMVKEK